MRTQIKLSTMALAGVLALAAAFAPAQSRHRGGGDHPSSQGHSSQGHSSTQGRASQHQPTHSTPAPSRSHSGPDRWVQHSRPGNNGGNWRDGGSHRWPNPPSNWRPPHRFPVNPGWRPDRWRHDWRNRERWFGNGIYFTWDPTVWVYQLPNDVGSSIYVAERTSNDLRSSFESQMKNSDMLTFEGGQTAWDRVQRMDETLETLRSRAGYADSGTMRMLTRDAIDCALDVKESFGDHPYLRDLVPEYWDSLRSDLRRLADYYNVNTGGL